MTTVISDSIAFASHLTRGLGAQERTYDMQLSIFAGSNYATAWSMRTLWEQALFMINVKQICYFAS